MELEVASNRLNEIADKKIELEEAIFSISLKLEEVKVKQITIGVMPDTEWLYRAKHALGVKKIELKKLNLECESLMRFIRFKEKEEARVRAEKFERKFISLAKETLSTEEFNKIKELANEAIENKSKLDNKSDPVKIRKGSLWTNEDETYLEENYKNSTIEELAVTLGRSESAIKSKIQIIKKKRGR